LASASIIHVVSAQVRSTDCISNDELTAATKQNKTNKLNLNRTTGKDKNHLGKDTNHSTQPPGKQPSKS
jgi:hypothetical protein